MCIVTLGTKEEIQPRCTLAQWALVDPMVCPPFAYGYQPNEKVWGRFYIDRLEDAGWRDDAFDSLILPPVRKQIVRSLVNSHRFPEPEFIRDKGELKGKGLAILLLGTPGSGKTLMAETVADTPNACY